MPDVCVMLFDPCQDNGKAYTEKRCIKLLLYLHIDAFTAFVDNGAHMTNYILHKLYACNSVEE